MGACKRLIPLLPPKTESKTAPPKPNRSTCAKLASSMAPGSQPAETRSQAGVPEAPRSSSSLTGPGGRGAWAPC